MRYTTSDAYPGPTNSRAPARYRSGVTNAQNESGGRTKIASVIARHTEIAMNAPMREVVSIPDSMWAHPRALCVARETCIKSR